MKRASSSNRVYIYLVTLGFPLTPVQIAVNKYIAIYMYMYPDTKCSDMVLLESFLDTAFIMNMGEGWHHIEIGYCLSIFDYVIISIVWCRKILIPCVLCWCFWLRLCNPFSEQCPSFFKIGCRPNEKINDFTISCVMFKHRLVKAISFLVAEI